MQTLDTIEVPGKGAFYGNKNKKAQALRDMNAHKRADAFLKGTFGEMKSVGKNGTKKVFRGCAVGCSVATAELRELRNACNKPLTIKEVASFYQDFEGDNDPHGRMAKHYNISPELAQLEDYIFESLPVKEAKEWPVQFLKALNTGADLSGIVEELARWLELEHNSWTSNSYFYCDYSSADIGDAMMRWTDDRSLSAQQHREKRLRVRTIRDKLLELMATRKPKATTKKTRKKIS